MPHDIKFFRQEIINAAQNAFSMRELCPFCCMHEGRCESGCVYLVACRQEDEGENAESNPIEVDSPVKLIPLKKNRHSDDFIYLNPNLIEALGEGLNDSSNIYMSSGRIYNAAGTPKSIADWIKAETKRTEGTKAT